MDHSVLQCRTQINDSQAVAWSGIAYANRSEELCQCLGCSGKSDGA